MWKEPDNAACLTASLAPLTLRSAAWLQRLHGVAKIALLQALLLQRQAVQQVCGGRQMGRGGARRSGQCAAHSPHTATVQPVHYALACIPGLNSLSGTTHTAGPHQPTRVGGGKLPRGRHQWAATQVAAQRKQHALHRIVGAHAHAAALCMERGQELVLVGTCNWAASTGAGNSITPNRQPTVPYEPPLQQSLHAAAHLGRWPA